ncbi:type II toxin-antitoxin system PemK/MazF family toxin [Methylomusa anaerophila]|uniref:mRNA interferase n=1 Tax=Methylomusa anaerophila TaxID=1930071 RepID=A0A348AR40_9FIRM|nr:type II toxin-antitoxin system PemK/MazF family toxin [Methylomusa anaerophila]BBB93538.1 mRNA interferase EndoA [Methylomusa anaerophila]
MVIKKWTIYWVNLDPVVGSEQGGTRPVLLVSDDAVNVLNQVSILPITSLKDPNREIYPNEAFLPKAVSGLDKDSIVLAHQIRTLDKQRLQSVAGPIQEAETKAAIEAAMRVQLGL